MTEQKVCTFDGCRRNQQSHGLCHAHRAQWMRGVPLTPVGPPLLRRQEVREELDFLIGTDHPESLAQRLGYQNADRMIEACRRNGWWDLYVRLSSQLDNEVDNPHARAGGRTWAA